MTIAVGTPDEPRDLAAAVFVALASEFYRADGSPINFSLRPKSQTQDDPFDEHVRDILERRLPSNLKVFPSNKPLVSPDLVVARPEEKGVLRSGGEEYDPRRLLAIEVKKLNVDANGKVARASGLDYNSTPPCETVNVTSSSGAKLSVVAFYLFAALVGHELDLEVSSMALVSGAALNRDVDLYEAATGVREKSIGIGSYGDGLDRVRPMFVFANPLGWSWLSQEATLIHSSEDLSAEQSIDRIRKMVRHDRSGKQHDFWCYRLRRGYNAETLPDAIDPFPSARNRTAQTSPRGRFQIDI